jgi:RNA polymerase sigma-70 factor (ECF subfamily)
MPDMTASQEPNTDQLVEAAASGDQQARGTLLERHRERLRRMIAVRLDPRLAPRLDPSDIVQETLAEADRRLDEYLGDRAVAFYPWLRQIATDRLGMAHRRHLRAGRRTVAREEPGGLPEGSALQLAERVLGSGGSPSAGLMREERRQQVRKALEELPERDREVLVLRYLEQHSTAQTAEVLGLSQGAVKMRLLRAVQRLHELLDEEKQP